MVFWFLALGIQVYTVLTNFYFSAFKHLQICHFEKDINISKVYFNFLSKNRASIDFFQFYFYAENLPDLSRLTINNLQIFTYGSRCLTLNLAGLTKWNCKSVNMTSNFFGLFYFRYVDPSSVNTTTTQLILNGECSFDNGFLKFLEKMEALKLMIITVRDNGTDVVKVCF